MRALVQQTTIAVISTGGLGNIARQLSDAGFRDVLVQSGDAPLEWQPRAAGRASFPDFLIWIEATPNQSGNLTPALVDGVLVTDAWSASDPGQAAPFAPSSSPVAPPPQSPSAPLPAATAAVTPAPLVPASVRSVVVGASMVFAAVGLLFAWRAHR